MAGARGVPEETSLYGTLLPGPSLSRARDMPRPGAQRTNIVRFTCFGTLTKLPSSRSKTGITVSLVLR